MPIKKNTVLQFDGGDIPPCQNHEGDKSPPSPPLYETLTGIFLSGGHCPHLNFDNPKRSKMWYVACGKIIRRVVAAAYAKSWVIDF